MIKIIHPIVWAVGMASFVAAVAFHAPSKHLPPSTRVRVERTSLAVEFPTLPATHDDVSIPPSPLVATSTPDVEPHAALPVPPEGTAADVDLLNNWLLNLPPQEFTTLVGTPEMDRMVDQIFAELCDREEKGLISSDAIDAFFTNINTRIESLQ